MSAPSEMQPLTITLDKCTASMLGSGLTFGAANLTGVLRAGELLGSLGLAGGLLGLGIVAASAAGGVLVGAVAGGCFSTPSGQGGPVSIRTQLLMVGLSAPALFAWLIPVPDDPTDIAARNRYLTQLGLAETGSLLQIAIGLRLARKRGLRFFR